MDVRAGHGRLLVASLLACILLSCARGEPEVVAGKGFPWARLVAIKKGYTTETDLNDLLGMPHAKERINDREERWRYYSRFEEDKLVLWVIPVGNIVTEQEAIIVLRDGLVQDMRKERTSFEQ